MDKQCTQAMLMYTKDERKVFLITTDYLLLRSHLQSSYVDYSQFILFLCWNVNVTSFIASFIAPIRSLQVSVPHEEVKWFQFSLNIFALGQRLNHVFFAWDLGRLEIGLQSGPELLKATRLGWILPSHIEEGSVELSHTMIHKEWWLLKIGLYIMRLCNHHIYTEHGESTKLLAS